MARAGPLMVKVVDVSGTDRTAQIPGRRLRAADRAADNPGGRDYQRFKHWMGIFLLEEPKGFPRFNFLINPRGNET